MEPRVLSAAASGFAASTITSAPPLSTPFLQTNPPGSHPSQSSPVELVAAAETTCSTLNGISTNDSLSPQEETPPISFVPSLGAWAKRINIIPEQDSTPQPPPHVALSDKGIPPPALKENGQFRFPWAAKMNPNLRNLHRATSPTYLEDGTPMVEIPNHVLLQGLENQKEYVIGQFFRCKTPSGGLVHAVANRIWGKKGKIFTRKLGESSFLFHIPDASTRAWVLQRGLWHVDECLLFVAPWTPEATLAMPEITSVPVWVTLKNIPSRLYSHVGFSWVASGLGEPVLTEKPRLDPTLMGEAKLLVEVELDKGFPHRIAARDKKGIVSLVDVEYSWIPSKCDRCGQLGHKESRCLLQHPTETVSVSHEDTTNASVATVIDEMITSSETVIANTVMSTVSQVIPTKSTASPIVLAMATNTPVTPIIAHAAIAHTTASTCVEADPTTPIAISSPNSALANTNITSSSVLPTTSVTISLTSSSVLPTTSVTISLPPQSDSLVNEDVQGNVFGGNQFAAFDSGDHSGYEIGDFSVKSRGGRPIRPTQKVQEMHWTLVAKRGKRGRGGRGGYGPPS